MEAGVASAVAPGIIQSFKNLSRRSVPLETALAARNLQNVSTTRGSENAVDVAFVFGEDGWPKLKENAAIRPVTISRISLLAHTT